MAKKTQEVSTELGAEVKTKPPTPMEYFENSKTFRESGDLDSALMAALHSVDGKSDRRMHWENLARILCEAGMSKAAEVVIHHALTLGFDKPVMYGLLGRALFKQQRYEDAVAAMDEAIKRGPGIEGYVRYRDMIAGKLEKKNAKAA